MKRFIKDGTILPLSSITVQYEDGSYSYNITEATALKFGWVEYIDPVLKKAQDYTTQVMNTSTEIDDSTALDMFEYFNNWDSYIGSSLKSGQVVKHDNQLYRVILDITVVLEDQFPSLDTAALYNVINITNKGTMDDPIIYVPPMEIFENTHYIQNDVIYLCTRNSDQALSHNLSDLIGLYVELA